MTSLVAHYGRRAWRAAADAGLRARERRLERDVAASLGHLSGPPRVELGEGEVAVVALVFDAAAWLDAFLEHYRALGARAFLFFDNGSRDETCARLAREPDVTVYRAPLPYVRYQAAMQRVAAQRLVSGGWVLVADADEHLLLPPGARLPDVVRHCEKRGFSAVVTQMLDLFPARTDLLDDPDFRASHDRYDLESITRKRYFASGNRASNDEIKLHFGGVRARLFGGHAPMLTKHALFRSEPGIYFKNPHYVRGATVADFSLPLLHYKFACGFAPRTRAQYVRPGARHADTSCYAAGIDALRFEGVPSRRLDGYAALVEAGFVTPAPRFAPVSASTPFVSVVVPMRDEAPRVTGLLEALSAQTYPRERFEVIVVDNGSTDGTGALCRAYPGLHVRVLEENVRSGPDAARNRALGEAKGEIFAFTDADCRPAPGWIAAGVAALGDGDAALAAGEVRAVTSPSPRLAEIYDAISFLRHAHSVRARGTAFTANLFVARRVFERLGPFPELAGWNGDAAFTAHATASGERLVYAPRALVRHPARHHAELLAKVRRIGGGKGTSRAVSRLASPWAKLRRSLAKPHVEHLWVPALRRSLAREGFAVTGTRVATLWLYGVMMLACGAWAFVRARRRAVSQ